MVKISHARCRKCGQTRHRGARFNLCRNCWVQLKPQVRAGWRDIKERRRARRDVHAKETLQMTETPTVEATSNGAAPPMGTKERAAYMRSFIHRKGARYEHWEEDLLKAYDGGLAPLDSIKEAFGTSNGWIAHLLKTRGVTPRADRPGWSNKPKRPGHFAWIDGHQLWQPWPAPEGKSQEVLEPEVPQAEAVESVPEPEQPEPKERRRFRSARLTPEQEAEVTRLYDDDNVPVSEIQRAYSVGPQIIMKLVHKAGLVPRMKRPGYQRPVTEVPMVAPEPAPAPKEAPVESNVVALVTPPMTYLPKAHAVIERAWAISYVVTRTQLVTAPSIDEALRRIRESHGADIEVVSVQRT
jgi:hypothetical protein